MRLLRWTDNGLELSSFEEAEIPTYAILSHTWGDDEDEVTFRDLMNLSSSDLQQRKGYNKIACATRQTFEDGLTYLWIDTCCIDKSSAAELSEAINSMFRWYQDAAVCYAYLSDVVQDSSDSLEKPDLSEFPDNSFRLSRWFTRGWTLQELIAPRELRFYDAVWTPLGSRETLVDMISDLTRIPKQVCLDSSTISQFSVAQRMSWAATRQTRRLEDNAYCLLGIFDINMPLLYGEGEKAFLRLQMEILTRTMDLSLLAWAGTPDTTGAKEVQIWSTLANHPSAFRSCGDVVFFPEKPLALYLTQQTIRLRLPLWKLSSPDMTKGDLRAVALLPCRLWNCCEHLLAIPLIKLDPQQPWKRSMLGPSYEMLQILQDQNTEAKIQHHKNYTSDDSWCLLSSGFKRPLSEANQNLLKNIATEMMERCIAMEPTDGLAAALPAICLIDMDLPHQKLLGFSKKHELHCLQGHERQCDIPSNTTLIKLADTPGSLLILLQGAAVVHHHLVDGKVLEELCTGAKKQYNKCYCLRGSGLLEGPSDTLAEVHSTPSTAPKKEPKVEETVADMANAEPFDDMYLDNLSEVASVASKGEDNLVLDALIEVFVDAIMDQINEPVSSAGSIESSFTLPTDCESLVSQTQQTETGGGRKRKRYQDGTTTATTRQRRRVDKNGIPAVT
ncbi:HET-domain-containing protein [Microthyrium microscopicum]|uniref:HET-domain-containing protein n=1 Tax=Microthyrium microscopicum TaxID=703497 RepID=A0A6A6UUN2_9PEZI|nr:HET-domain-containing protein [Microthyrium microscopicum]